MNINSMLRIISKKIVLKNNPTFNYPVAKQKKILKSIKQPKNYIERSYAQYKCQAKLLGKLYVFFASICSLFVLLGKIRIKDDKIQESDSVDAFFPSYGIPQNIIPEVLREEFVNWNIVEYYNEEQFTERDKAFFDEIWKNYPFSFLFLLKCLIKIRMYSAIIQHYHPKAIVVCSEYSYTSSILTAYCEEYNVEHIDIMHGEKLFDITDSFFAFHRCYVWDEFYVDLFKDLGAKEDQFRIELPASVIFDEKNVQKTMDYTYYLCGEDGEVLKKIVDSLIILSNAGNRVAIRPHPRYSNVGHVKEYIGENNIEIEATNLIDIENSVLRTNNAISLYSTVLFQAYHNGTKVVIDNISNPAFFAKLSEVRYIMLDYTYVLLQDILEENNEKIC